MASLDLWETLPVWIVDFAQDNPTDQRRWSRCCPSSVTWLVLTLIVSFDRSQSRRTSGGSDAHEYVERPTTR